MKITRHLLTLAAALTITSGAYAQNQSQSQTTPPTTTESNKAQTGTASAHQAPTTDPTDSTTRQQQKSEHTSAPLTSDRNRTVGTAAGSGDMLTPYDRKFLMMAAEGGMAEVKLAQMAQTKASSQAVKDLAKTIEQDHMKANEELKRIAGMRRVDLPTAPPATGNHAKVSAKLERLSGEAFDRAYVEEAINDHKKDIKEFERLSNNGMDTDLKAFASSTLPTLKSHLQAAQSASGKASSASKP